MQHRLLWGSHLFRPPPLPREVHFWCLFPDELQDASLLQAYEKLLSSEEQHQLLEARNAKLRREHLLSRTLVRATIARYAGGNAKPASLKFERNKYGKPEVVWPVQRSVEGWAPPSLRFNLSHTSSFIACGVTVDAAIGVDVEDKNRALSTNLMTFARRKLSKEEANWLENILDPEEQRHCFLQLWTLKEAYVKALGKGISATPLQSFSVCLKSSPSVGELLARVTTIPAHSQAQRVTLHVHKGADSDDEKSCPWNFFLFEPTSSFYASICVERPMKHACSGEVVDKHASFKMWRTVPLCEDIPLHDGAVALGYA